MSAVIQFPVAETLGQAGLLAAVLEASPEALAVSKEGRVVYSNPAFARLFTSSDWDGVQGRLLTEIIPEIFLDGRKRNSASGETMEAAERLTFTSTQRDKTQIFVTISSLPERNVSVVTARRTTEAQVEAKADSLVSLGRAVSSVVHDFNNLITGVLLYSELLASQLPQSTREHAHALQIRRAAENGARLTRQLLSMARPAAPEKDECCWNPVIAEMQELLSRLAGAHIQLETKLTEGLEPVKLTSVQMQQILLNLVLNARDAMPEGGRLLLETHCSAKNSIRSVALSVSDSGTGMSPEAQEHIFEPFFTTKEEGKGNGLGLSGIGNIVKQNGGCIQVESAAGGGTRVVIQMSPVLKTQIHKNSIHNCTKRGQSS